MNFINALGLQRPRPPSSTAKGIFQIDGVTVINPMHNRRHQATHQHFQRQDHQYRG
jgi:hypothetical protein